MAESCQARSLAAGSVVKFFARRAAIRIGKSPIVPPYVTFFLTRGVIVPDSNIGGAKAELYGCVRGRYAPLASVNSVIRPNLLRISTPGAKSLA